MNALKDPTYRFPGNYGVEKFLELFSGTVNIHIYSTQLIYIRTYICIPFIYR